MLLECGVASGYAPRGGIDITRSVTSITSIVIAIVRLYLCTLHILVLVVYSYARSVLHYASVGDISHTEGPGAI